MENCEMCQMKKMLAHVPKVPYPRGYGDGDQSAGRVFEHYGIDQTWDFHYPPLAESFTFESLERNLRRMQGEQERRTRDAERQLRELRGLALWERLSGAYTEAPRSPGEPRRSV